MASSHQDEHRRVRGAGLVIKALAHKPAGQPGQVRSGGAEQRDAPLRREGNAEASSGLAEVVRHRDIQ